MVAGSRNDHHPGGKIANCGNDLANGPVIGNRDDDGLRPHDPVVHKHLEIGGITEVGIIPQGVRQFDVRRP